MERRKSRWIRCVSFKRMRGQRKGGKEDWEEQKRRWGGDWEGGEIDWEGEEEGEEEEKGNRRTEE